MRILIAYDGSPSSEAAVDEVVRRPWPQNSEVRLVMAVERPLPAPSPDGAVYDPLVQRMQDSLREEASRKIREALRKFRTRTDLRVSSELKDGNAKHCLLDTIREWKAVREKMKQVLINLVRNAIEAMPDGGQVNLSTQLTCGMVSIAVADTGTGITARSMECSSSRKFPGQE